MSAYALPGSIFPPMGGGSCSAHESITNFYSTSGPLHDFSDEKEKLVSIGEDLASACSPSHSNRGTKDKHDNPCDFIAVKEAKIDPVRLVQAVTGTSHRNSYHHTTRSQKQTHSGQRKTPHEDAIQFELSIKFNGRTYGATRTLPRIMEFRNDLIREIDSRREMLQNRRKRWQCSVGYHESDDDDLDVTIPELPEMGLAGRGFAMLQALLRSYCPVMERWLSNVMDLVPPNSPVLANFLWEPVSVCMERKDRSCGNSALLQCIQEDEVPEDECEYHDDREDSEQR